MKLECLPFSQIPHTTRLFVDFLSNDSKIQSFYPRSPYFKSWLRDEAARVGYDAERREQVCAVLERQNRSWGASPRTIENLARLRAGASAVVTGQQVGLFGGPLFSILKSLTAVRLSDEATKAGIDCVPVFWLATEDHDVAEVSQVSLLGSDGLPRKFSVTPEGITGAPVGSLVFSDEIGAVVNEAAELLGDAEVGEALRQAYRPGETFGSAFAKLFARIFAEWGVILLDGTDPELHRIAKPIYRAALERAEELDGALLRRGTALEAAGYHQQVKVTPSSTLLFCLESGSRVAVHRRSNGHAVRGAFLLGKEAVSQAALVKRIDETPQHFSANALLRPVIQDYLLPTLAYAGGAAEVAYFAQAAVIYEALLGRVTPVVPRFSATLIEPKAQSLLDKYQLRISDLFRGPEDLRQHLAQHILPADLQTAFHSAEASLEKSLAGIQTELARLDSTLVNSAAISGSKMRYQLSKLRARAARAELRKTGVIGRHANFLSNALYPKGALQEREVGGIDFLARRGPRLLKDLYEAVNPDCLDHQLISLA